MILSMKMGLNTPVILTSGGGTPPEAKATGGNAIKLHEGKYYHVFTGSGNFTPSETIDVEFILIGAGGGCWPGDKIGYSGGGGAGGIVSGSETLTATAATVVVGQPKAGLYNGEDSTFAGTTAKGGGLGGRPGAGATNGNAGGSGGGGGGRSSATPINTLGGDAYQTIPATPSYDAGYGNPGGSGGKTDGSVIKAGGGGGGAGGPGGNATYTAPNGRGGAGGAGKDINDIWPDVVAGVIGDIVVGVNGIVAGGGGGHGYFPGAPGSGGAGVSGASDGTENGRDNTGSGGGGPSNTSPASLGGSGLVIIRYSA